MVFFSCIMKIKRKKLHMRIIKSYNIIFIIREKLYLKIINYIPYRSIDNCKVNISSR